MVARPRVSERTRPLVLILGVAILLFAWVFLYRFNTLGGAFGGFDNDHFLHFVHAKQVQAGGQPIRDFLDAGLQGARPSLTYELSAAAQRYFGDNLRSEAWLTVGGVALGAAVAFVAGSLIAPWPWALVTAWLSAIVSPKLYSYPKVLVVSVASLLIVSYPASPTWTRVGLMAAWTAIAFLFRNDLAVYCAVGFLAVIVLSARTAWRPRLSRAAGFVVITAVLLGPSLWWIQRYRGLTEYVRNGLEMSRNESDRTRIGWPGLVLSDGLSRDENLEAWLYYAFLSVPVLAVVAVAYRATRAPAEFADAPTAIHESVAGIVALSLMTTMLGYYFLRGNLAARFGDLAPAVAVLGAYLLALSTTSRDRSWTHRALGLAEAVVVLGLTMFSIWQLHSVGAELRTGRLLEPGDVFARTRQTSEDLASMPRSLRERQAGDRMQAADYLHRCTRATDRVLAVGYFTDILTFSERLFAGGRAAFFVGFYSDERYSREMIARLEAESVPIVLGGPLTTDPRIPLLADYLRTHYEEAGTVQANEGTVPVLVRRGVPSRPLGPGGLPCFG
jgi:hypothetical protein